MVSRGSFLEGGLNRFLKLELVLFLGFDTTLKAFQVQTERLSKRFLKES
jgi:hypothetical protein